jgi:hypothetical protein
MPMNAERLAEYIEMYDVDLERSLVAMDGWNARSCHAWRSRRSHMDHSAGSDSRPRVKAVSERH